MSYKVIGAIGDSITNGYWDTENLGWFGRLSQKIAQDFPMQYGFNNMSQDGDRVCDAFHRVACEVCTREMDFLLIAIGTNDVVRSPKVDSPTDISEHLRVEYWHKMLDLALKNNIKPIVIDILPVIEKDYPFLGCFDAPCFEKNDDIKAYNKIIENICKEKNVLFIKRYDNWDKLDLSKYYEDECHPNAKGHQLFADEVYDYLKSVEVCK